MRPFPRESNQGLWASLKKKLVPDSHAHPYAEGVARGHPLVMADVGEADLARASAALQTAHPINIEDRATEWVDDGWNGVHDGQGYWLSAQGIGDAASSGGITAGGLMSGDYGSVAGCAGGRGRIRILPGGWGCRGRWRPRTRWWSMMTRLCVFIRWGRLGGGRPGLCPSPLALGPVALGGEPAGAGGPGRHLFGLGVN